MFEKTRMDSHPPCKSNYDVIVVGSGMGGGTMAYALKDSGLDVLLIERGDFLPQERQNWDPRAVFEKDRYKNAEKNGSTPKGGSSPPAPTITSAETPNSTVARWSGSGERIFIPHGITTVNRRHGRSRMTISNPTTHVPSRCTRFTATTPTTRRCHATNRFRTLP